MPERMTTSEWLKIIVTVAAMVWSSAGFVYVGVIRRIDRLEARIDQMEAVDTAKRQTMTEAKDSIEKRLTKLEATDALCCPVTPRR